jgi:hypothetical protein
VLAARPILSKEIVMPFNNFGQVLTVKSGETVYVEYYFNDGNGDHGAQYAMAQVETEGALLFVSQQGKQIDAAGNVKYYVTVRNDINIQGHLFIDAGFQLQGGGFSDPINNYGDLTIIDPNIPKTLPIVRAQGFLGQDLGTQFYGADVKTKLTEIISYNNGKTHTSFDGEDSYTYYVTFENLGDTTGAFYLQGGGMIDFFNNYGPVETLEPGQTYTYPYQRGLGEDKGAQYATADIKTLDSLVVETEQGKLLHTKASSLGPAIVSYYVLFINAGNNTAAFNIQGGGLV